MTTEGDRLKYYIENKEVSILNFCKKNEIIYTSLHPILQNSRPLGIIVLKKIMDAYPNLNINWVLTGKGNVEINPEEEGALSEPSPIYGNIDPGYQAFLKYLEKEETINMINNLIDSKIKSNERD
jgi:hypothetical protein